MKGVSFLQENWSKELSFFIKRAKPEEEKLDETTSSKHVVNNLAKA